ncbi:MAG TPA: acetyl-CoA carboxylase biotin carboxyl carrier protein [Verrucomicrobiales bacterium]|nr:acetyl-CoA carboxylase biotin carboxyl carrier protein [Verrucomicrobiales bacterium]HCI91651.1 acetyl-CoA carboxylase biotin carboxyl carrier protein [Verrucomicrobiales bacterium]HCL97651.1 acetyl-CoA carboxylase biotin carboxyl carrier protein [Verrucomicrobiales bacterium]
MDLKEIRKIVELMNEHELSYFHLEEEGVNLKLKKGADIVQVAQAAMPAAAPAAAPATQATTNETPAAEPVGNDISAPMVGTFYASPSPDSPPFVNVGDTINEGQTICIIEAMKVMNEIKAETSGTVSAIVAKDGEPVQFGDALYRVQ